MFKKISLIVSYLFHPVFYLTYLFTFLILSTNFFSPYFGSYKIWLFMLYIFINSVVLPLIIIYFIRRDFLLADRKSRTIPYLVLLIIYVIIYLFFRKFLIPQAITNYFLSLPVGVLILLLINHFYLKVSLHTSALGTLIALFLYLFIFDPGSYFSPLMIVFLLAGFIGSCRLFLNTHSLKELFSGYVLGFSSTIVVLLITPWLQLPF